MPIHERFAAQAWVAPNRPAIVCDGRTLAYGAVFARARSIAWRLTADGLHGRTIALLLPNRPTLVTLFFGAAMAGVAPLLLDPKWSPTEVARAIDATQPALIFVDPTLASMVPDGSAAVVPVAETSEAFQAWLSGAVDLNEPTIRDTAVLFIGFTSGTTGAPKAYRRTHASWAASLEAAAFEFGSDTATLIPGPLAHSLFLFALIEGLTSGATVTLLPRFDPEAALALLVAGGIARVHGVPAMYAGIVEEAEAAGIACPAVRTLLSAGAKLPPALRARLRSVFPGAAVHEYYGASELSFVTVNKDGEGVPADAVGRPFRGVAVSVRRADGSEADRAEVGELWVRSPMLCAGYLNAGADDAFRQQRGWATVGDHGWRDGDGFIYLAGRSGGVINSGGINIHPAEVEAVLRELPAVADAAVVGLPDDQWGEIVVAVLCWRPGADPPGRGALIEACRARLARYKWPRRFYAAASLPLTPSGKVAVARVAALVSAASPHLTELR